MLCVTEQYSRVPPILRSGFVRTEANVGVAREENLLLLKQSFIHNFYVLLHCVYLNIKKIS